MSGSKSSSRDAAALEPLGLTVHSVATPDLADPALAAHRRTRKGRLQMLIVLLACASPVIASYLTYFVIRPEGRTNYSALIQPSRTLPATLDLHALTGERVLASTLRGQWLLVAVGPAGCEAACERRLYLQRQLREMLGRERHRVDKLWLVTDGAEVPAVLRANLEHPAAGAVTMLRASAEGLAQWLQPAPERALDEHLYVVDPMGEWMLRIPVDPEPARVKRDLERLLRASSSWDTAGR